MGAAPRAGFEIAIPLDGSAADVAARALDSSGNVLATSKAITT